MKKFEEIRQLVSEYNSIDSFLKQLAVPGGSKLSVISNNKVVNYADKTVVLLIEQSLRKRRMEIEELLSNGQDCENGTTLIHWHKVSDYTGGRVLVTNGIDVEIGKISEDLECACCDGKFMCGITHFAKIDDTLIPK